MSYVLFREPRPETRVYSVAEVCQNVRSTLEERYGEIAVEGEITGCKRYPSGHVYFSLKDRSQDAVLPAVLFAGDAARVRTALDNGLVVRCVGTLSLYVPRGGFQMKVRLVAPVGAGDLAAALEALKAKLEAEGLFAAQRKRPLPLLPKAIGVVTSKSGAAWGDIVKTITRRFPSRIVLSPTLVQGDGAARQIVSALELLQRVEDVDVVILGRGGGAVEDLWAFNDEAVARAIAACRVPVVSAVGHERDVTIADLVADLRAATPTAAGEHVVPTREDLQERVGSLRHRLGRAASAAIREAEHGLTTARHGIGDPQRRIEDARQALDGLVIRGADLARARLHPLGRELGRLEVRLRSAHPRTRLVQDRALLAGARGELVGLARSRVSAHRSAAEGMARQLEALSPLAVLARGYAVALHDRTGRALVEPAAASPGDALTLVLRGGRLKARVE
ncbi:MAG: exodeoxyribonuclease VII large subunit [Deltaproteobacteria bacterium]|nr:exodeoxyribonuclease VII large subunit [Deltaproteobacteria bacterium]